MREKNDEKGKVKISEEENKKHSPLDEPSAESSDEIDEDEFSAEIDSVSPMKHSKRADEELFSYTIKVPGDRIAAVIGKGGETKREIEAETGCILDIDSHENEIEIFSKDSIKLYTAKEVIRAISRGFNPKIAVQMLKSDYTFEVIELRHVISSVSQMKRLKGRVIGEGGKARKTIEDLTDTNISVYGKTIGVIGEASRVAIARKAIELLLKGSAHHSVYTWLERKRRELRDDEFKSEFGATDEKEIAEKKTGAKKDEASKEDFPK
ncbi:MAG: KH domain-containing protein [Candidatus Woesearchaeota archaeon]|nr:KH domain-containing protein [Candidatus Woesearchaeota archaeon]